jgi:hypothetical protein
MARSVSAGALGLFPKLGVDRLCDPPAGPSGPLTQTGHVDVGHLGHDRHGHAETLHLVQITSMSRGSPTALKPSVKPSTIIRYSPCI